MKLIKEIYAYRQMIVGLTQRELRGRYKGSVLGFLWTFLNPLFQLLIYIFLFGVILGTDIPDFYLYLFVGLIPWLFFQNCLSGGANAVINQKALITKIYFPREVIPISYVTTAFINMLYCFVIVVVVVLCNVFLSFDGGFHFVFPPINPYGDGYSFLGWLTIPIVLIIQYLLCLGVCFIASSITVYFRDLEHILSIVAMAWTYCTPIMYQTSIVGEKYEWLFYLNPMTSIVEAYHNIFYYGKLPDMSITSYQSIWVGLAYALVIFVIGVLIFEKAKKRFAEEL